MRTFLLLLLAAALVLPLSADDKEKISFDVDDRFSIEFPEHWIEKKAPKQGALVHREHKDADATFTVSRLLVPADRSADLHATLKSFVGNYRKAEFTIKGAVHGQEGQVDGKKALFANVPATIVVNKQAIDLNFFVVFIEARERLIILEATLPADASNELRRDCRVIIGSFEENEPGAKKKKEKDDEEKKEKADEKEKKDS